MTELLTDISQKVQAFSAKPIRYGKVSSVVGTVIEATGLDTSVGEVFKIHTKAGSSLVEVVGMREQTALLMPHDRIEGMQTGALVEPMASPLTIKVDDSLLGRVVDAHGEPIDGFGAIGSTTSIPIHNDPPGPLERENISDQLFTGVRSIDSFISVGRGQRMGIFAGSGVGKSVMMGMIARHSSADVNVIGLIGERGREVKEFIDDVLGPEGMARSVVVAVTSDRAAMSRVKGAYTATAIAEYFRDQGKNVLLMMDSVTRVAMAQREIGLASGEPPTTKGYTPSVFTILPKLLERAGRTGQGSITGLYTVLVDNDDMTEPIADAVRSIIDGHIVLSRDLAHKNHYPAVDVLQSVSRVMPNIVTRDQREISQQAREILAIYREAEDLINIGAYVKGSNPKIDRAISRIDALDDFLRQDMDDADFEESLWDRLLGVLAGQNEQQAPQQTQPNQQGGRL